MTDDPHSHVERQVVRADYRNVVSSPLGTAVDAPSEVTTGCGTSQNGSRASFPAGH